MIVPVSDLFLSVILLYELRHSRPSRYPGTPVYSDIPGCPNLHILQSIQTFETVQIVQHCSLFKHCRLSSRVGEKRQHQWSFDRLKGCPLAQLSLSELRHHSFSLYGWPLPENDRLHWGCLFSPNLINNQNVHKIKPFFGDFFDIQDSKTKRVTV